MSDADACPPLRPFTLGDLMAAVGQALAADGAPDPGEPRRFTRPAGLNFWMLSLIQAE